jgi:hypothetical protein
MLLERTDAEAVRQLQTQTSTAVAAQGAASGMMNSLQTLRVPIHQAQGAGIPLTEAGNAHPHQHVGITPNLSHLDANIPWGNMRNTTRHNIPDMHWSATKLPIPTNAAHSLRPRHVFLQVFCCLVAQHTAVLPSLSMHWVGVFKVMSALTCT